MSTPQPKYGIASASKPMTFTKPRATLDELLAFANRVREAGGGNPLDALMPAVPNDPSQCLIAKNLNFNCEVDGETRADDTTQWYMRVADEAVRNKIASALGLVISTDQEDDPVILLPDEIGQVAHDFDHWKRGVYLGLSPVPGSSYHAYRYRFDGDGGALDYLKTFWPFIDASVREAYKNATFVNEKGEIIL